MEEIGGDLMSEIIEDLMNSLKTGFIDKTYRKNGRFKPEILINNEAENKAVLTTILEELHNSQSFLFSVAFITESGLATLKSQLLDLKMKGVKGRILTSTYLNFNQPKVFKELLKLSNVEVRLTNIKGFHSKGYIFEQKDHYSLIVGSTNLTSSALKVNHEWNIKLTSHADGEIVNHFKNQFEEVWQEAEVLTNDWINRYENEYIHIEKPINEQIIELQQPYDATREANKIEPNKMQEAALKQIQDLRDQGKEKGMVISATGTGKTYLSAFDVRRYQPKRLLFIVHREQILQKAKDDYMKLLGGISRDFGILSGTKKEVEAKYLFATIQTLSKDATLQGFDPNDFDYILIDEVHKAGAKSYQKVIDYFNPKFLLGMTATPERTDDINIFELFDYNIAYEIRLQEALEAEMLCPFHYFGVTDLEINGEVIDDSTILRNLVTAERVEHIIEKLDYYSFAGKEIKGLMFCSQKNEARELSLAFNNRGLRTVALTGDHSQEERSIAINQLESGMLDYIITVDIFNEGVDIPCINQVVMLRQTESSIIFIQQLGRGLRKHKSKEYLSVIDFIGNYKNNYLIPIALSGDRTQNKDNLRRHTQSTNFIKGLSTINFEEIAKKRIFDSIKVSNLTSMHLLKKEYEQLKDRIGRTPYLIDFEESKKTDPTIMVGKFGNYYEFLLKMKEQIPNISEYENKVLKMLSLEMLNGKRKHEVVLINLLMQQMIITEEQFISELRKLNCRTDRNTLDSVYNVLNLGFFNITDVKKYGELPIVELEGGNLKFNEKIVTNLKCNDYFKKLMNDIVQTSLIKCEDSSCDQALSLYGKYSRKEVCKYLNWEKDESATMFGYKPKHQTCPIFITYHKNEDVESSVNYGDEFLDPATLKWFTRSNRTVKSREVQKIINAKEQGDNIHLFVKKDDDEGIDFYYLGEALPDKSSVEEDFMKNEKGKNLPVVHMNMVMEHEVEHDLYQYLVSQ